MTARVPHESTVRELARRLGPEVIDEMTRALIATVVRERRFTPRAMRVDSTVVEADVRWPSDAALAHNATRLLARQDARVAQLVGDEARRVRDRSRAASRRLRLIGRTVGRRLGRAGRARDQVLAWTAEAGDLVGRSMREARRLAAQARAKARGRGARRKFAAAARLDELADRAERVTRQIRQRVAGEKIGDRLVSLADPRRAPDRQGQARQALRVRLRLSARRDHREHAPRRARPDPAGGVEDRLTQ